MSILQKKLASCKYAIRKMSNKERKIRRDRERQRKALILCAFFSLWSISYCELQYCSSIFVAAFDLRVCLQLLSSQALTMSPIMGRRESLGFFMASCTKGLFQCTWVLFCLLNGGENLFSAKCPGGHGPQIFRLPCPALSCILLGPAFYFLAKFCHLATEKTERARDLSKEDFLGEKKKQKISPHF